MSRWFKCLTLIAFIILLASSVMAQRKGKPFHKMFPPGCGPEEMHQMEANYENLRLLKFLEAVDLNEEQAEKFIPIFHSFRREIKSLRKDRAELLDQLSIAAGRPHIGENQEVKAGSLDESQIKDILEQLEENQNQRRTYEEKFKRACDTLLELDQKAKFVIFQERFEREVLQSLREFRRCAPAP